LETGTLGYKIKKMVRGGSGYIRRVLMESVYKYLDIRCNASDRVHEIKEFFVSKSKLGNDQLVMSS